MTQPDMFAPPAPEPCCAVCVHLNYAPGAELGHCSPQGYRRPADPACEWYFPKEQLRLATARRPA